MNFLWAGLQALLLLLSIKRLDTWHRPNMCNYFMAFVFPCIMILILSCQTRWAAFMWLPEILGKTRSCSPPRDCWWSLTKKSRCSAELINKTVSAGSDFLRSTVIEAVLSWPLGLTFPCTAAEVARLSKALCSVQQRSQKGCDEPPCLSRTSLGLLSRRMFWRIFFEGIVFIIKEDTFPLAALHGWWTAILKRTRKSLKVISTVHQYISIMLQALLLSVTIFIYFNQFQIQIQNVLCWRKCYAVKKVLFPAWNECNIVQPKTQRGLHISQHVTCPALLQSGVQSFRSCQQR